MRDINLDEDLKGEEIDKKEFIEFCKSKGVSLQKAEAAYAVVIGESKPSPSAKSSWKKAAKGEPVKQPGWPDETYAKAHRQHGWNIVQFLEEHYAGLIAKGEVTRIKLRGHDPSAEKAISNYLHGGQHLPKHLHIATKKELNDRLLEGGISAVRQHPQLAQVLANRLRRGIL